MRKQGLTLCHQQRFLDGEHVWAPPVRLVFPQFVSLTDLQSWVKKRMKLGAYLQALTVFYQSGNKIGGCPTLEIYKKLVAGKGDDVLGRI